MAAPRHSVQFRIGPPEIIHSQDNLRRTRMTARGSVAPAGNAFGLNGLSGENQTSRRKRLAKLLVIFAIPVVAVFAQCGVFLDRMLTANQLSIKTNETIYFLLGIGSVISCVQKERETSSLRVFNGSYDMNNLWNISARNVIVSCYPLPENRLKWPSHTLRHFRENLSHNESLMLGISTYRSTLIWYTDEIIAKLIRLVNDEMRIKYDNNGTMWAYIVVYEMFMRIRDNLEIQKTLSTIFMMNGRARKGDLQWFIENGSICEILLNISQHYLNASKIYPDFVVQFSLAPERWNNGKNKLLSAPWNVKNVSGKDFVGNGVNSFNTTARELLNAVNEFLRVCDAIQKKLGNELKELADLQRSQADVDRLLSIGLLTFSAIVCPLLAMWYMRSVSDLSILVETYTSSMSQKAAELTFEQRKTEHLLYQMLPPTVAQALKHGASVPTELFEHVTVFFSVVANFRSFTEACEPLQVVEFLNTLYMMMDTEIERFDVYKVETIGDEYMVASGLPKRNDDKHASEVAELSLRVMEVVEELVLPDNDADMKKISLRIGLHSGSCVAGVVGQKMPRYCLFGDTVNTASRMESTGKDGQIHLSLTTKECLDPLACYVTVKRGTIAVKGKQPMLTFWLVGKKELNFRIATPEV